MKGTREMTKSKFYWDIKSVVDEAIADIRELEAEKQKLENEMKSSKFQQSYIRNEMLPMIEGKNRAVEERKAAANKQIKALADDYVNELNEANELRGEDLTDDAKLLTAGVKLTGSELEKIFDRYGDNPTMQQIVHRYADENNVKLNRALTFKNSPLIEAVSCTPAICEAVIKWADDASVYSELMPQLDGFKE
jgi:predicted nuclease with TOPRIM domain